MERSARINKYNGKTGELISTRTTILTRAELIEALMAFWDYIVFEYEGDATIANVYTKKGDKTPAFSFEISTITSTSSMHDERYIDPSDMYKANY